MQDFFSDRTENSVWGILHQSLFATQNTQALIRSRQVFIFTLPKPLN